MVDREASKKAYSKRSAIFEETKLKNWEKENKKYLKYQEKNCKGLRGDFVVQIYLIIHKSDSQLPNGRWS